MPFTLLKRATALAAALVLIVPLAVAGTVYSDQATFVSLLSPGYYLENYSGLAAGTHPSTINFSQGAFSYTASASQGLWVNSAGGNALSTNNAGDPILFTFTSGNVTAVGGYFFPTDIGENLISGTIALALSDGTTATLVNPGRSSFFGFTTSSAYITSLSVDAPDGSGYAWPTVDDLYVGVNAVPEPSSAALLGACLLLLGWTRWRRRR